MIIVEYEEVICMMYFDEIMISKDEPEYNNVCTYCDDCGKEGTIMLDEVTEFVDKDHVTLKDGVTVKCKGCGEVHEGNKITYKPKSRPVVNLPRCPICQSTNQKYLQRQLWAVLQFHIRLRHLNVRTVDIKFR